MCDASNSNSKRSMYHVVLSEALLGDAERGVQDGLLSGSNVRMQLRFKASGDGIQGLSHYVKKL